MSSSSSLFKQFKTDHRVFIETGLLDGIGVRSALEAGFEQIFSIEMDAKIVERRSPEFASNPKVQIITARSEIALGPLLQQFSEPVLLWLDAHSFWGGMGGGSLMPGTNLYPLYAELDEIAAHPIKTHTVLIDDIREFGAMRYDYETVITKLKQINPAYRIQRVNSGGDNYKNDVLAASIVTTQWQNTTLPSLATATTAQPSVS